MRTNPIFLYCISRVLLILRTARGARYNSLIEAVKNPGLEYIQIDDIGTGDFTKALEDVDAVLHIACRRASRRLSR